MSTAYRVFNFKVTKEKDLVAVSLPIPDRRGRVSKKTPVYNLPVYKVQLELDEGKPVEFRCDLADLMDLMEKLKRFDTSLARKLANERRSHH